jgi:hypothetical protein
MKGVVRGPLRPIEAGSAAVLFAAGAAIVLVDSLLPRAGALELLAAVPSAVLAQRQRARSLLAVAAAESDSDTGQRTACTHLARTLRGGHAAVPALKRPCRPIAQRAGPGGKDQRGRLVGMCHR